GDFAAAPDLALVDIRFGLHHCREEVASIVQAVAENRPRAPFCCFCGSAQISEAMADLGCKLHFIEISDVRRIAVRGPLTELALCLYQGEVASPLVAEAGQ